MADKSIDKNISIIPYIGSAGSSEDCSEAIIDCLCRGDKLDKIRLLTSPPREGDGVKFHGFFLDFEIIGCFVVFPGYASGYEGGGPHELSRILAILYKYRTPIIEITLAESHFERLNKQCLTSEDIDSYRTPEFNGGAATGYVFKDTWKDQAANLLLNTYAPRLPLPLIHPSIQFLSTKVFTDPDDAMRESYVILESKIRKLADSSLSGTKLFDESLKPREGTLSLKGLKDSGEQAGLQFLMKGLYQLHRNPRMHRHNYEPYFNLNASISEFLVINHLFHLSDKLELRPDSLES